MFYLCKLKQKAPFWALFQCKKQMKDRIRQIMESKHMTQQVFADFIGTTPATLSGIFNDRTRPTINIVESIKKKIPDINTDWLMFGSGEMYQKPNNGAADQNSEPLDMFQTEESNLDFGYDSTPTPKTVGSTNVITNGVRTTHLENGREAIKFIDKPTRHVTEIRVYYDDQTWESFVPAKK